LADLEVLGRAVSEATQLNVPNCIGFIDGTVRSICKPLVDQEAVYNGHRRVHALKYQAVVIANGLIVDLFGPRAGFDHDARLFHESELNRHLGLLHRPSGTAMPFFCFGDQAYPATEFLCVPFRGHDQPVVT
jgi:hypothetical protein